MLDVHDPHEKIHGWWDFFVHLFTITVGLLIALSLEGCVEWQHHRHLVHEAEASLRVEINSNSEHISGAINDLYRRQELLKHDLDVLNYIIANKKAPNNPTLEIGYSEHNLSDVSWRTAQTTTALSYMSYKQVQEYADIYMTQEKFTQAEQQGARDAILSLAPFAYSEKSDARPAGGQEMEARSRVQILAGQLSLVEVLLKELDAEYKKFLAAHPE